MLFYPILSYPDSSELFFQMDAAEFRIRGKQMIDYVADYLENIRDRRPLADVQPGYLHKLIPEHAPQKGEKWEDVFGDIERVIMPGVSGH